MMRKSFVAHQLNEFDVYLVRVDADRLVPRHAILPDVKVDRVDLFTGVVVVHFDVPAAVDVCRTYCNIIIVNQFTLD